MDEDNSWNKVFVMDPPTLVVSNESLEATDVYEIAVGEEGFGDMTSS